MTSSPRVNPTTELIEELLRTIDGQVTDRSRVVDGLLDIRQVSAQDEHLTSSIDELLRAVPGKTMVPTEWYRDILQGLAVSIEASVPSLT
jgi:hypothetical protein